MQFLKTLFWCLLAFVAAMFTRNNWTTVPVNLWGGLIAEINLPLLLLITFLIGLVPMLAFHHAARWRMRSRLATSERTIATLRDAIAPAPVIAVAEPAPLAVGMADGPETRA
jgi:lipopolysaccharide assembly protein A